MKHNFTATIYGERAQEFKDIFGGTTVPIMSPIPEICSLGPDSKEEPCYMLNIGMLTQEQFDRLVKHVAGKFGAPEYDIRYSLETIGLPIRAGDCVVTIPAILIM